MTPAAPVTRDARNARLKLHGAGAGEVRDRREELRVLAEEGGLTKITVYAHERADAAFGGLDYRLEAEIAGFFADGRSAWLYAAYPDPDRGVEAGVAEHDRIVELARGKPRVEAGLAEGYTGGVAGPEEAGKIAALLARTFPDYPTPISEEVVRTAITRGRSRFRLVRDAEGRLAGCASAELDHLRRNAELTDCATAPQHRGRGLMTALLADLAADLKEGFGITDLYTIARADEPGVNCAFARLGYRYTGRLVNNCRMPNGWESMNVWCHPG